MEPIWKVPRERRDAAPAARRPRPCHPPPPHRSRAARPGTALTMTNLLTVINWPHTGQCSECALDFKGCRLRTPQAPLMLRLHLHPPQPLGARQVPVQSWEAQTGPTWLPPPLLTPRGSPGACSLPHGSEGRGDTAIPLHGDRQTQSEHRVLPEPPVMRGSEPHPCSRLSPAPPGHGTNIL